MDRVFLFLAALGAFMIVCQWYVFTSVRTYLLGNYEPVSRKAAYSFLVLLGVLNLVLLRIVLAPDLLPPDSLSKKIASVAFFSYLGCILVLSLFFLVLGAVFQTVKLKDLLVRLDRRTVPARTLPHAGERGCVQARASLSPRETPSERQLHPASGSELTATVLHELSEEGAIECRAEDPSLPSPGRRAFLKCAAATGVVAVSGSAGLGLAHAYQKPVIETFDILHPRLEGLNRPLTIIQITDFHFGMFFGSDELLKLVEMVNGLAGDALFITGDVFHTPVSPVQEAIPLLKRLRERPLGNFVILGNHDFYAGEWRSVQSLTESGLKLLRNSWVSFSVGRANIHLGGIDDPLDNWMWGKRFPDFPPFMRKVPSAPGFRIVLSHRPNLLPLAADADVDLVLAGHTHGGQIIIPGPGRDDGFSLARIASPFTHGWYTIGDARMYLNRGVGLTFVPWRINCPPEVSVFYLQPSNGRQAQVIKRGGQRSPEFVVDPKRVDVSKLS